MFGPEKQPLHGFGEDVVIGHLNLNDPEEKAWFEEMEEGKREFRERHPSLEEIAKNYREGYLSLGEIQANLSEEELQVVWSELEKLKNIEE